MNATATLTPAGTCEQDGCDRSHAWTVLSGAHEGLVCVVHLDLAREPGVGIETLPQPEAWTHRSPRCADHRMMTMLSGNRACALCGALAGQVT